MKFNRILGAVLVPVLAASVARAQLPSATLTSIFPPGGQAGTSLEVALTGKDLNAAERLEFSHAGISGVPVMAAGDEFIKRPQWQRNRFTVTVAAEVPPGVYQAWFVGSYGISNPVDFVVGDLPQGTEISGNNSAETAHPITLNSVLVGHADGGKSDCFRVALKAGQQVVIDCEAARIGSQLDAVVGVFDAAGKRLAQRRGTHGEDPVFAFKAPVDGDYVIEVADFLSGGGGEHFFRLVVGDRPWIRAIFPPAALPGTKTKHTISGVNLPGGAEQIEVEIEQPQAPVEVGGGYGLRPRELPSAGANYRLANSNQVRIPFATAPVVIEDSAADVQKVAVPAEIAGHLVPGDDLDAFEFEAKKGERLTIEAISQRAGHATDLLFTVSRVVIDAEGKRSESKVGEADDDASNAGGRRAATNSRDPLLAFTAPEDGSYVVRLIDQFQLGDPQVAYRLSIRQPVPDFALMAEIVNPVTENKRLDKWSPALLRGGKVQVDVWALRRDGFDGEIQLSVDGVPGGVEVVAGKIEKGATSGAVMLSGGAELNGWAGAVRIIGKAARPDGGEILREAFGVSLLQEVNDYDQEQVISRLDGQVRIASSGAEVPVSITVEGPQVIETSIGGNVELPLKVAKQGTIKGALKLIAAGIPNVTKPAELSLDLNKDAEGKLALALKPSNENKYAPGTYQLTVRGEGVLEFHADPLSVAEATADQQAVEPLLVAANEALKAAQAKKDEIAKSTLTADEKTNQLAAAEAEIGKAQERAKAAEEAKKRAADLLAQANGRDKARDLRIAAYANPITLVIAAAPLQFKDVAAEIQVTKGGASELAVGFERLYGYADAVELSLAPPKDLKGFDLKPVAVPNDQAAGKLTVQTTADAAEGEHAFQLVGKVTFNGVPCELRQPVVVKVLAAPPAPAAPPAAAAPVAAAPAAAAPAPAPNP